MSRKEPTEKKILDKISKIYVKYIIKIVSFFNTDYESEYKYTIRSKSNF